MLKIASTLFLLVSVIDTSSGWAKLTTSLREKYPNHLMSDAYGIVTTKDIIQDSHERTSGRYWQCVPTSSVKRDYNASMDEDGMGPAGVEIMMCDLEIIVDLPQGRHVYGDRRRHPNSFCQQFERNWRRLTRNEKIVCFNGDDPSSENDTVFGKYISWVWNKFKTKRGCYSYFEDRC